MNELVTNSVAAVNTKNATSSADAFQGGNRYDDAIVTHITKPRPKAAKKPAPRRHLFLSEWLKSLNVSDDKLGERLNLPRQTIYRWRTQEHRLDPQKIVDIADALGITPTQLWAPPGRASVDALLTAATPNQVEDAVAFVERFILK